jgi:hypothetical protein
MVPLATTGAKLACERLIDADPVPSTVPRATQFHELLAAALRLLSRGPVAPLPLDWRFPKRGGRTTSRPGRQRSSTATR